MSIRIFTLFGLLVLSTAGHVPAVASGDIQTLGERANAQTGNIADAEQYLASIDHTLELASKGEYGKLKRGSEKRLRAARDLIAGLLEGHASARELPQADRIAIFNAQETIKSIIDSQDKDRMVCSRTTTIGSILPATECMTVGERERRGRDLREGTDKIQRNACVPNEFTPCAK